VKKDTGLIDYDEVKSLAVHHRPKLIVAGCSAYPRQIDFVKFRAIAEACGAYLMVDMAHFAGLVAAGLYPNPLTFADVVTTTTHKTLRGPRGGAILTNNAEIAKKINSAIFPGMQGGPLAHVMAAKAVCFKEALSDEFKQYSAQVIKNAQVLGETLQKRGLNLVTGGTDTHLLLVDLTPKGLNGKELSEALESVNITANKNAIPFDPLPPTVTSGIRLGTPAGTTRGFKEKEFQVIGEAIADVVDALHTAEKDTVLADVKQRIKQLTAAFPIYKR
jgi:glycine hydroxymethyltransferase